MGPNFWEPGGSDPIHKCDERVSNTCTDETDGCCGVIPCTYCIEWNPETGETVYSIADFATNSWAATIAGAAWLGFWERNYETGECEFVVTLDGVEIYRKSCYEGQSCRDSSDSAGATIGEVSGVISWTKYENRPLQYVQDEETNCTVHFCDDCECAAECVCVTITEPNGTETKGEICDTAYDCEPPLWAGTVGAFELSIALGRDEYGRCIITGTVGEEEAEPVLFPGCADASATITLYDGTTIEVTAKKCSCISEEIIYPCECANDEDLNGFGSFGVREGSAGPCDLEYTSSSGNGTTGKPTANIAWIDAEDDCVITLSYLHKLTAFPPDCMSTDPDVLSKRLVFVKKGGSGVTPNIDNGIVQENDWYVVVYAATTDTILGVFYDYDICCQNETPENAATSHFVWVRFPGVILGDASYTVGMYSQNNADTYGNCGYDRPTPVP